MFFLSVDVYLWPLCTMKSFVEIGPHVFEKSGRQTHTHTYVASLYIYRWMSVLNIVFLQKRTYYREYLLIVYVKWVRMRVIQAQHWVTQQRWWMCTLWLIQVVVRDWSSHRTQSHRAEHWQVSMVDSRLQWCWWSMCQQRPAPCSRLVWY